MKEMKGMVGPEPALVNRDAIESIVTRHIYRDLKRPLSCCST